MTRRDDPLPSFDPRSWIPDARTAPVTREGPAATALPVDGSFDPRTWRVSAAPPTPDTVETVAAFTPSRARTRATAAALGAGILAAGAVWSWTVGRSARLPLPRATTTVPASAVAEASPPLERPPAPPVAGASRRTLNLPDAAQLLPALRSLRLADGDAGARRAGALLGSAPGEIRLQLDLAGGGGGMRLVRLEATRRDGAGVRLAADGRGGFAAETLRARLATSIRSATGEMDATTFYASAVGAGVPDSLIGDFANAFSFDFDFQREVAPGDVFEAAWEQPANPAGEAVGPPRLVYASLATAAKRLRLYRMTPPGAAEPAWFDAAGRSNVRALMRTPVEAARVTSGFGYRLHPILGYRKLHRGTDFAAPTGTPVYAAANGAIDFATPRGAAGNMVRLRHDNGWFTHYFHLSAFAPGLEHGTRVTQGQRIGDVGTTGRSTGPHLHYELWIDGEPVDPLGVDTGGGTATLEGTALAAFRTERARIDAARAGQAR